MAEYQFHRAGNDAAIYKDGVLLGKGDTDQMIRRIFTELVVITVDNDAFMLGQDKRTGIAATLGAIATWKTDRQTKRDRIIAIKVQVATLRAEAKSLGDDSVV
jgi:hypothetical protein